MTYQIITVLEGQAVASETPDVQAWAAVRGIAITGYNTNTRQRAELQGQPKLAGFCGPMWNGNGVIRYESTEAYQIFSS